MPGKRREKAAQRKDQRSQKNLIPKWKIIGVRKNKDYYFKK